MFVKCERRSFSSFLMECDSCHLLLDLAYVLEQGTLEMFEQR
jgi:hypothetical protein